MSDIHGVVAAMSESPWNADTLLARLSKATKAAVRKELLARAKKAPERYLIEALGAFPDAEVIAFLQKLLANKKAGSGPHVGAVSALEAMNDPASRRALAGLVDHPEDNVARTAIETLQGSPATIVKALLPRLDAIAKRRSDFVMCALVEKLVAVAPKNTDVIAAVAKHWEFSVKHDTLLSTSNAIFDALIKYAPRSPVAQEVFVAALASGHEYGIVRGRCALALTGRDTATHVKELKKMKGLEASSSEFRRAALKSLGKA